MNVNRDVGLYAVAGLQVLLSGCAIVSSGPCSYRLVFSSYMNPHTLNETDTLNTTDNVFTIDPTGTERKAITWSRTTRNYNATISQDGQYIAYRSNQAADMPTTGNMDSSPQLAYNMWRANGDGTGGFVNLSNMTSPDGGDWCKEGYISRDGTKVTCNRRSVVLHSSWSNNVLVMNIDGSNATDLTQQTLLDINSEITSGHDFSPDMSKIVFSSNGKLDGTPGGPQANAWRNLFIMNADGTGKLALTRFQSGTFAVSTATFSHDGAWIYFVTNAPLSAENGTWTGSLAGANIWRVRPDGTELRAITRSTNTAYFMWPSYFFADGSGFLAYGYLSFSTGLDTDPINAGNLWSFSMDGTSRLAHTRLTGSYGIGRPHVSPDESLIAFTSRLPLDGPTGEAAIGSNIWVASLNKDKGLGDMRPITRATNSAFAVTVSLKRNAIWAQVCPQ